MTLEYKVWVAVVLGSFQEQSFHSCLYVCSVLGGCCSAVQGSWISTIMCLVMQRVFLQGRALAWQPWQSIDGTTTISVVWLHALFTASLAVLLD
jgi:hypothetical protein